LKVYTIVAKKQGHWFVKFDEDSMPEFSTLKTRLKELSDYAHEKLAG